MLISVNNANVNIPHFDEETEWEMTTKGCCFDVTVTLEGDRAFQLDFYDPVRLAQDIEAEMSSSPQVLLSTTTIILPEVTKKSILAAIERLLADGFFAP